MLKRAAGVGEEVPVWPSVAAMRKTARQLIDKGMARADEENDAARIRVMANRKVTNGSEGG